MQKRVQISKLQSVRPQTSKTQSNLQSKPRPNSQSQSRPKPNLTTFSIPPYIDGGVWRLVFQFVGANKDLLNCREVCKKWKLVITQSVPIIFRLNHLVIDSKNESLRSLMTESPFEEITDFELHLDKALKARKQYQISLKLIPQKSTVFTKISDLAKIRCPTEPVLKAMKAFIHLFTSKEELKKREGTIDWKYIQKRLAEKDFLKRIQEITPENLDKEKMARFLAAKGDARFMLVCPKSAPSQLMHMCVWAIYLTEYKNLTENFQPIANIAIKEWDIKSEMQSQMKLLNILMQLQSNQFTTTNQ